jgi:cold shock CspA family protein
MRGKIRKWVEERGFGFVSNDDGRDAFFHFTAIQNRAPEHIHVGEVLEYDLSADGAGRLCAKNARVIDQPTAPIKFGDDIGVDEVP